MKKILMFFVVLSVIVFAKTPQSLYNLKCNTLKLNIEQYVDLFYSLSKKKTDSKSGKEKMELTITNLDTATPKLIGNVGTADLVFLPAANNFYLFETTANGNIVVYTIFPQVEKFTITKQYSMAGSPYSTIIFGSYYCF